MIPLTNTSSSLFFHNVDFFICKFNSESLSLDFSNTKIVGVALDAISFLAGLGYIGTYYGKKYLSNHKNFLSAVQLGLIWKVKLFLAVNAIDVNLQNSNGKTALMFAAEEGYVEIVKVLLAAKGINVNQQNNSGKTALIFSAEEGHTKAVKALLSANGIKVNHRNKNGQTALMLAAYMGHTKVVQEILRVSGVDINYRNKYGWTPFMFANRTALMLAAKFGYTEIVQSLLTTDGIKVNYRDNYGLSALRLAEQERHIKTVEVIENYFKELKSKIIAEISPFFVKDLGKIIANYATR